MLRLWLTTKLKRENYGIMILFINIFVRAVVCVMLVKLTDIRSHLYQKYNIIIRYKITLFQFWLFDEADGESLSSDRGVLLQDRNL